MPMMYSRLGWPFLSIDAQNSGGSLQCLQSCTAKLGACRGGAGQETLMFPKAVGEAKLLNVFCEQGAAAHKQPSDS